MAAFSKKKSPQKNKNGPPAKHTLSRLLPFVFLPTVLFSFFPRRPALPPPLSYPPPTPLLEMPPLRRATAPYSRQRPRMVPPPPPPADAGIVVDRRTCTDAVRRNAPAGRYLIHLATLCTSPYRLLLVRSRSMGVRGGIS
ncbi:hypothetical protein BRADI_4g25173v3 [Brachypodium distachyon]|uniref:Uncharacterized protein n=1 Tax=Brachypodium distachyon TaxID=15368 RepID=A0A2K2CQ64_BRADI|nr:hypothetical protein BRADI_4g25173v3 [Brachypodium distachyon]